MEQRTYPSTNGRDTVTAWLFPPPESPVAVVQLVHGMAEHLGRYIHFAQYLTGQGYLVCGLDHVGHGKSVASAEDYGYWGENGPEAMVGDMAALRADMGRRHPGLPYFLLGHSMGSFVLRRYLAGNPDPPPAGIILSGTGAAPFGSTPGILLGRTITALYGDRHRSALLNRLCFGGYNSKFKSEPTGTGWEWLTRELRHVEQFQDDKSCGFVFTVSALTELIGLVAEVNRPGWYRQVPTDIPLLLLSGDMDPVGGRGRGVRLVADRLRAAGATDLTLTLYPGGRHEVLNEQNRAQVYGDIARWLNTQIEKSKQGDNPPFFG